MRLQGKLAIDHYIGGLLAWVLNFLFSLASPFVHRDHSLTVPPRTVLFLKFIGLGSIVRSSFLISAVRKKYPDSEIVFATFPGCAPLVHMYDDLDQVMVVRDNKIYLLVLDSIKLILWCWRKKVELVIDLEVHSKYSSLVTATSLARDRAGFGGYTSRFRTGLYTHLVFWNPVRLIDQAYEQLGAALGLNVNAAPISPTIPASAEAEAQGYLKGLGISDSDLVIGINPNSSELRMERCWPLDSFAKLINSFSDDQTIHFLIVGSPAERVYTQKLRDKLSNSKKRVQNAAGAISFAGFSALLKRFDLLVTNDSGPMHLASALQVPIVSLWGPTHPAMYAPKSPKHIPLYQPIYCSPCTHFSDIPPCAGDNQCLKRLSAAKVSHACHQLLELPFDKHDQNETELDDQGKLVYGYWQRDSNVGGAKPKDLDRVAGEKR